VFCASVNRSPESAVASRQHEVFNALHSMNSSSLRFLIVLMGMCLGAQSLSGDDQPPNEDEKPASEGAAAEQAPASPPPATAPPETTASRAKPLTAEEVRESVRQLASDRYDSRESATKRLGEAGGEAIAPLIEAAQGSNLEVTCRAVRAIAAIAQRGERETFELAQEALEKLADSKNRSAAHRANIALGGLAAPRSRHARARIAELGAIIKPRLPIRGIIDDEDAPMRIQVVLNRRWKGGDEGLVYLRRIDPMELEAVYVTRSVKISKEALVELVKAAPHLTGRIQDRGDAMLGVTCDDFGACIVSRVNPDTAAARCGLEVGDKIVTYDGQPINTFQQLTEITKGHDVGDKIKIEVMRDNEFLELEATLGDWE